MGDPGRRPARRGGLAFEFQLRSGAIVTSTTRMRTWRRNGRRYHHLIDPSTGESTRTGVAAVVAHAPDAWWAEGIAKAVIVAGAEAGGALAPAKHPHPRLFFHQEQGIQDGDDTQRA